MADELNIPTHRWYEPRNNIALPPNTYSAKYIYANGVALIDAWINSQPWGDPYIIEGLPPQLVLDFTNEYYRTDSTATTFDSALTATRAGNATMVDSDGKIKWAPHNLLTYSEDFSNAAWTKANVTVTANSVTAPDGTITADRAQFTVPTTSYLRQVYTTVSGASYTISCWVKSNTGSNQTFRLYGNGGPSNSDIFVATTEWQLFTYTYIGNGASATHGLRDDALTTADVLVWGAHLYRSDLGGMVNNPDRGDSYVPTTSSARYLARRGHHIYNGSAWVNEGMLHESEARTNLVTYSNDFTQWTNSNSTDSIASAVSGPDGITGVTKLTPDAGSPVDTPSVYILATQTVEVRTFSVFMRAAEYTKGAIRIGGSTLDDDPIGVFDLSAGSVLSTQGIGAIARIQSFGGGWYKCSLIYNNGSQSSGTGRAYAPNILPLSDTYTVGANGIDVTADGTSGIYIYGAQLEAGPTPSSYIPTAGATVTRAADTLTVPSANLPWPTPNVIGPELVTNGTFDTDTTGWTGVNASLSAVSGALRVTISASGGYAWASFPTVVGKVYSFTTDCTGTGTATSFRCGVGISAGNLGLYNSGTIALTAATISSPFVATGTTTYVMVQVFGTASQYIDFDNISVKEINPLSVSIQMDGRMTYADTGNTELTFFDWRVNSGNYIQANLRTQTTATGEVYHIQAAASVADDVDGRSSQYTPGVNVPFNIASRHGSTFINGAVDGVALTADLTPVALPDLSATNLQLGYTFMGVISKFRVWSDDLGDTGIAEASA